MRSRELKMNGRRLRGAAFAFALLTGIGCAANAQAPGLDILAQLDRGEWVLRTPGETAGGKPICVTDPALLLQLRHGTSSCNRFVIASDPHAMTVHYTCPGAGYGRTTITMEAPKLAQIDTQGVAGGEPFQLSYEARWSGACTGNAGKSH
jgi:hypothetical protein